jgi:hypothetical protein
MPCLRSAGVVILHQNPSGEVPRPEHLVFIWQAIVEAGCVHSWLFLFRGTSQKYRFSRSHLPLPELWPTSLKGSRHESIPPKTADHPSPPVLRTGGSSQDRGEFSKPHGVLKTPAGSQNRGEFSGHRGVSRTPSPTLFAGTPGCPVLPGCLGVGKRPDSE